MRFGSSEPGAAMQTVLSSLGILHRFGQKAGPYLMLEILLPGGTLLALLLLLYRHRKFNAGIDASRIAVTLTRVLGSIAQNIRSCRSPVLQSRGAGLKQA